MATAVAAHATSAAVSSPPEPPVDDVVAGPVPEADPALRMPFIQGTSAAAVMGAVAWTALHPPHLSDASTLLVLTLAIAAIVAIRSPLQLLGRIHVSGESIPIVACAVLAPDYAVLVALATSYFGPRMTHSVRALSGSQVVLSAVATTVVSHVAFPHALDSGSGYALAIVVLAMVFLGVGSLQVFVYEWLVWSEPPQTFIPVIAGSALAAGVFATPLLFLIVSAAHSIGPIALPMVLVPVAITQYFHGLYHRTEELAEKAQVLARTNLQFAAAMVKALDQRDAYTAGHSAAAVAVYTRDIAREMGFDDEVIRLAHLSGLLHDIGKIGVPGRVLNKTAPLDDDEYELMKSHAAMGAEILGEVDLYADIAVLVRYHHERIDGRGYPDGIAGEAIPAISRMISVADTYSAMTTDRPYRDGMPTEKAMSILRGCRGSQLDGDFTDAFLRILIVADEAYQRGKQTDFEVEVAKHQALSEVEAEAIRIHAPAPAGPVLAEPLIPAAVDGELIEVELEREAA